MQWGHLLGYFDHGGATPKADGPAGVFTRYLASTKVQVDYYKATGGVPGDQGGTINALAGDSYLISWLEQAKNARPDELSAFGNGNELRTIIGEEITAAMLGQKTAGVAVKDMASRLTAANPHP